MSTLNTSSSKKIVIDICQSYTKSPSDQSEFLRFSVGGFYQYLKPCSYEFYL